MVNFVIDNLLLSTKNRVFYETLWSLVIHKKKVEQKKYHAISLVQICNDLLDELNIEGQNNLDQKNRFYFTTQIAFGAVQVYKLQIDKLFNQVKHALVTCTSKAFVFDWLSSSQSKSETNVKKRKLDETDVLLECEALECLDEELFKMPHPRKKVQLTDPTTVRNSRSITLLEEFFPTQSIDDCHHNEFGIMSVDEFEMFIESDRSQESVKTMLDCMKNKKRKMSEEISDDIARTSYQTKLMKSCDISQDFSCFEDPILHDVVTSFDSSINQVNIIEDDTIIENHETYPPVLKNTENYDLNSEINVEEIMLPRVDRLQFKKKQKRIKKCIFVDKHMKITNKSSILSSFVQYQKLQTEDLPRVNFEQMIYKHKFGVDVLFQTQARRNMSPHLLLLVKRHLKKIPQTLIDRKFTKKASIENETTPILKRPTTRFNRAVIKCSGERFNNTILETELLDQEDEMLKSSRMQHYLIDDEVTIPGPAPKRNPRTNYTDFEEYDEDKKWSQEMIMERLEVLWNTEVHQINMQTLCGRLNRFVCAGIFFELMNLSKVGLITLEKKNGRQEIYNIQRNE